jgi:RNA polymerase sigma-70 factor (ECF subfamily)
MGSDATAFALAAAWERWDEVQHVNNPAGYVYAIGRNHARRERMRESRVVNLLPDVTHDIESWVEPKLPEALGRLSERQRLAVMLVYGLGWSLGDVAELIGVSKSTVQTQADRGMKRLRRMIGVNDAQEP